MLLLVSLVTARIMIRRIKGGVTLHRGPAVGSFLPIDQFRIVQQQKNRVEVQGNNLHFPLFWTIQNANYATEPRLCSFVAVQFETGLLKLSYSLDTGIDLLLAFATPEWSRWTCGPVKKRDALRALTRASYRSTKSYFTSSRTRTEHNKDK